jgi:hypothetical protein
MSYVHNPVEALFQILGLVEVWTRRSMELCYRLLVIPSSLTRCGRNQMRGAKYLDHGAR